MMLLVDVDQCLGCCACEVGCQQRHPDPPERRRVIVRRRERPGPQGGAVVQDRYPEMTGFCDLCASLPERDPFCAEVCPVKAIRFCDGPEAEALLRSGRRYQIAKG